MMNKRIHIVTTMVDSMDYPGCNYHCTAETKTRALDIVQHCLMFDA